MKFLHQKIRPSFSTLHITSSTYMSCNQRVRKKITQNASLMQPKKKSHFALENMCIDANSAYSVFNFIFWTMNEHLGLTQPQTLAHEGRFVPNQ